MLYLKKKDNYYKELKKKDNYYKELLKAKMTAFVSSKKN